MREVLHIRAESGKPCVQTSDGRTVSGVRLAEIKCEPGELPVLTLQITDFTGDFQALSQKRADQ